MTLTARYWDFYDRYVVCVRRDPEYPINRYYAHLVDPFFTKWAYDLKLSPNAVTTLALISGVATGLCLLTGANLSAAILLQLHHFLDGADGNLARLTDRCTPGGARYDQISDRLVRVVVFSSVAWMADVAWGWRIAFLGVLILDHLVVQNYIVPLMARVELDRARWKAWFLERGIIPGFDHFTLFFLISVCAALGRLDALIYVGTTLKLLDLGYRLWECAKSQPIFSDLDEIEGVAKQVDFWTVAFDYWFSLRIVSYLRHRRVSPDQITFASFGSAIAGAGVIAGFPGQWPAMIAAALLFQLSYIFDCADGQLARIRSQYSRHGWRLDLYSDRLTETIILVSVTYSLAAQTASPTAAYWLLGMSVLGATTLLQYSRVHELLHAATFASQPAGRLADESENRQFVVLRRAILRFENVRRKHRLGFMNVGNFYFLNFVFLVAGRADLFLWSVLVIAIAATAFHVGHSAIKQADTEAGLQRVVMDGKKAVLFGAGEGAAQFVAGFRKREIEIAYVCDNNSDRWGTRFHGAAIVDPKMIADDVEGVVVFIASEWASEIHTQLTGYGLPADRIVSLY
ncbi:MAG: CDP-alcohol phosphatidyltransferase family protein [Myxococcales bacterium]|nr:CDP-alcohol phosphatidyltransferase family protein [Myxococcales bacterium]